MDYADLILGMKRYGSSEEDICKHGLGVSINNIKENVIIAPWWEPDSLPNLGEIEYISGGKSLAVKVWNITNDETEISYVKTGIGAPVLMDAMLSLGVTKCKRIIFIGSVGSLDADINIGDIVLPQYSICGDGASRYITKSDLKDIFGQKVFPNKNLSEYAKNITERICKEHNVKWHKGYVYSIDTIFAQFAHIDNIFAVGCNVIEMETAAAFKAAILIKIPITALLSVSDNIVANKSLVSGRTQEEMEYRRYVRKNLFPEIILALFKSNYVIK